MFGPWDPKTFEVEDSTVGYIKMANGAAIALEASWALNVPESREASTTLCGILAGAEIASSPLKSRLTARGWMHATAILLAGCPAAGCKAP